MIINVYTNSTDFHILTNSMDATSAMKQCPVTTWIKYVIKLVKTEAEGDKLPTFKLAHP